MVGKRLDAGIDNPRDADRHALCCAHFILLGTLGEQANSLFQFSRETLFEEKRIHGLLLLCFETEAYQETKRRGGAAALDRQCALNGLHRSACGDRRFARLRGGQMQAGKSDPPSTP